MKGFLLFCRVSIANLPNVLSETVSFHESFLFSYFSGAFLIPFVIMIVIEGAPLLLVELGIGQRLRTGSFGVWNMVHPAMGGIGIASTIVAFLVGLYYNVIITWCFFFLFNSFRVSTWFYISSI